MKFWAWRFGAPLILGAFATWASGFVALQEAYAENKAYLRCGASNQDPATQGTERIIIDYEASTATVQEAANRGATEWAPVKLDSYQMPAKISDRSISWRWGRDSPLLYIDWQIDRGSGIEDGVEGGENRAQKFGASGTFSRKCVPVEPFRIEPPSQKF